MVAGSTNPKHTVDDVDDSQNGPRKSLKHFEELYCQNRLTTLPQSMCEVEAVEHTVCGIKSWAETNSTSTSELVDSEDQNIEELKIESKVSLNGEKRPETVSLHIKPYTHSIDEILCKTRINDKSEVLLKEPKVLSKSAGENQM